MDRDDLHESLCELADHLHRRRDDVLEAWSRAAERDRNLSTAETLTRVQFYDHIPRMLDALEERLRATSLGEKLHAKADESVNAAAHGLQRWQQGYDEREVMREWSWLNDCLGSELERFAGNHPEIPAHVIAAAARTVAGFLVTGMSESMAQYARLQRLDATTRLGALEDAHRQLTAVDHQRSEWWREAAHDLRGNVSIIHNVATGLRTAENREAGIETWIEILGRSVASLRSLLDDLMTQARLDAGEEHRQVSPFDAAALMRELVSIAEPIAVERGLSLSGVGPMSLPVEGDAVKVRRIAQNLLLNALSYTQLGRVIVAWETSGAGAERWMFTVQDSGPGLSTGGPAAPLSNALDAATRDMQQQEKQAAAKGEEAVDKAPTLTSRSGPRKREAGEGIGLAIVKRLCELLDATLELQTESGKGTTFRVTFPSRYAKG
jgi:signal transduction histidine kinase